MNRKKKTFGTISNCNAGRLLFWAVSQFHVMNKKHVAKLKLVFLVPEDDRSVNFPGNICLFKNEVLLF